MAYFRGCTISQLSRSWMKMRSKGTHCWRIISWYQDLDGVYQKPLNIFFCFINSSENTNSLYVLTSEHYGGPEGQPSGSSLNGCSQSSGSKVLSPQGDCYNLQVEKSFICKGVTSEMQSPESLVMLVITAWQPTFLMYNGALSEYCTWQCLLLEDLKQEQAQYAGHIRWFYYTVVKRIQRMIQVNTINQHFTNSHSVYIIMERLTTFTRKMHVFQN